MSIPQRYIKNYFKRFASDDPLLSSQIDPSCRMIIVIPCYDEPDLIGTLESLVGCVPVEYVVEVIVVVNDAEYEKHEVRGRNKETIARFKKWNQQLETLNIEHGPVPSLKFQVIQALDLPVKTAGVGLARKIGMDEALRRFVSADLDGAIVCLDADCRVSSDYLKAIDKQFVKSDAGLGEMHFEHPYDMEDDDDLREGIINYELFLRYYVEGLRQAGFPNAIHTIGSCMLVSASVYAKHGGMNKRKAGEDFYFLHKLISHEKFVSVDQGTVYPSCRTSFRVPFGTGKAQHDWLNKLEKTFLTYDPRVFADLKTVTQSVDELFDTDFELWISSKPPSIRDFFQAHNFAEQIERIKANTVIIEQFRKQFYVWFDGFICLKFVHYTRDNYYPNQKLNSAASTLAGLEPNSAIDLLEHYRKLDLAQP